MKKTVSLILAAIFLLSLSLPAFAAGSTAQRITVTDIKLPVAGEKVPENPGAGIKVKILVLEDGESTPKEISATPFEATWAEADKPDVHLTKGDAFVAGRTYRYTVTLEFMGSAPTVKDGETKFYLNGEEGKHLSNEGERILFYGDFVATPGDFTPKVSLSVEGSKSFEYDGKGTKIIGRVDKTEGVLYEYAWYRDDQLIPGAREESLTVKNVSDSGEYYCKVSASLSSDSGQIKTTKSASQKITVLPHVITIEIHDAEKNLFDPDPEFTYDVLGEVYDDLSGSLSRMEGEDIGKYSILIGTLAFPQSVAENYEIRVDQGTLTIIDVGKLPFVNVKNLADQSYITGKSGAKIRVSATRGAISDDAILSLSLLAPEAKEKLEEALDEEIIKGFSLSLVDKTGKKLSLPRHASLKLQIPLAQEEENLDPKTILAGLYTSSAKKLETEVTETSSVTYITVQIDELGNVALLGGEEIQGAVTDGKKDQTEKEKGGYLWMWILIALLSLGAIGAIVFTYFQIKKNGGKLPPKEKQAAKAPLTPEEAREKEKARRIARELNALPPVPEKPEQAIAREEGMKTRKVSLQEDISLKAPQMAPEVKEKRQAPAKDSPGAPEAKKEDPHVISFEDLED